MNENLEKEKKVRADVEKVKRKLENDLKLTQESVEEYDRIKRELEDNLKRSVRDAKELAVCVLILLLECSNLKEIYIFSVLLCIVAYARLPSFLRVF